MCWYIKVLNNKCTYRRQVKSASYKGCANPNKDDFICSKETCPSLVEQK